MGSIATFARQLAIIVALGVTVLSTAAFAQGTDFFGRPRQPAAAPATAYPAPPPARNVAPAGARPVAQPAATRRQPTAQPVAAQPQQQAAVQPEKKSFGLFDFFRSLGSQRTPRASNSPFGNATLSPQQMRPTAIVPEAPTAPPVVARRPVKPKPVVEITTWVAVIGDDIAEQLGSGLVAGLEDSPAVAVRRKTEPGAGLIDQGDSDFVAIATETAASDKLTYVVIEIGKNDRRPFMDGDREIAFMSEEWKQRYATRVDAVLEPFRGKAKVLWVGAPPMQDSALSADLVAINEIIRARVTLGGATYVDVWEGFVDEDDAFAESGPDLEGRVVRLRLADGVLFTKAGSRKLAHYPERAIRRDIEGEAELAALPDVPLFDGTRPPPDAGPLIVLTAPVLAPRGELDGGLLPRTGDMHPPVATPVAANSSLTSPADEIERILVRGEAPQPMAGRLDDASWVPDGTPPPVVAASEPFGPHLITTSSQGLSAAPTTTPASPQAAQAATPPSGSQAVPTIAR